MASKPIERLQQMFAVLDPSVPMELASVYTDDVTFQDPFHSVEGRDSLQAYFERMNANIETCTFEFYDVVEDGAQGFLTWTMRLKTKRGPKGIVEVDGTTHVRLAGDLVRYHRDYFDAAKLVYEHVPLLGGAIRAIRKRM